jgi:glutamate/tyrosine decarboxylase-like PLP-dependent enzyme
MSIRSQTSSVSEDRYDFHLHVDAAYGGFYRTVIDDPDSLLAGDTRRHLRAIEDADSVVVDPHKHGLQPYGCGAVLFRDPSVGRLQARFAIYVLHVRDLHLGEISLECSRAGAAAAALWLTLEGVSS